MSTLDRNRLIVVLVVTLIIGLCGSTAAVLEEGWNAWAFITDVAIIALFIAAFSWQRHRYQTKINELQARESAQIEEAEKAWFEKQIERLSMRPIRNDAPEVEVEAKFIFPLLGYLGYEPSQMHLRVPVPMQEGSQQTTRQADWVVRAGTNDDSLIVVEAKAARQRLDDAVAKQARSYAFRLEAPVYATTNGKELRIYRRGVLRDQCVLSCDTRNLLENSEAIEESLGKSSVKTLKDQLG